MCCLIDTQMECQVAGYKSLRFRDMIGAKNTISRIISTYIVFTAKKVGKISSRESLTVEEKSQDWALGYSRVELLGDEEEAGEEATKESLRGRRKPQARHLKCQRIVQEGSDDCGNSAVSLKM